MQAEQAGKAAQAASQAKQQELQLEAQLEMQKIQAKAQAEMQLEQVKLAARKEIELIKAQAMLGLRTDDQEFREKLEVLKEDGKNARVDQQAELQSQLIAQKEGEAGMLDTSDNNQNILNQM